MFISGKDTTKCQKIQSSQAKNLNEIFLMNDSLRRIRKQTKKKNLLKVVWKINRTKNRS